jgi:hypothetical protein
MSMLMLAYSFSNLDDDHPLGHKDLQYEKCDAGKHKNHC